MAITRTLTFTGITINGTDYSEHLQENAEVTIEPVVDLVDDGQTLPAAYDLSFSVDVYDDAPLSDNDIYSDSTTDPVKSNITFNGVAGGGNIAITNIIINANKKYDQNRLAVTLSGTKRTTSLANASTDS